MLIGNDNMDITFYVKMVDLCECHHFWKNKRFQNVL